MGAWAPRAIVVIHGMGIHRPHSDYWTDDRVLEVIGRSALPKEAGSEEGVRTASV